MVMEMRRVATAGGRVLIVDQHAPENYEQASLMNRLEVLRDPTHAVSRPPSAFRIIVRSAGLKIVDEHLSETRERLSRWIAPGEFPQERLDAVIAFLHEHGHEAGMDWERDGDDWAFTRRRIMLLAERA